MTAAATLPRIAPEALRRRLEDGSAVLVDVREPDEYRRERIAGARLAPLSRLEREDLSGYDGRTVVFCCRSGNRTTANADRLCAARPGDCLELEGGLLGWKQAGLPTELDRKQPLELMRQVQIVVGAMVLLGLGLAVTFSPWFALLSAVAGGGLLMAGLTGFCGMARLLARAPWNRPRPA
jgi:rhodanese-related sulfurtransferase